MPEKQLTDRAKKVASATEQYFWELGMIPAYEMIAARTGEKVQYVKGVIEKNALARKRLIAAGVDLEVDRSAEVLTPEQLLAANVVLNSHDKKSLREKLDMLGISSQQWHAWMRQPGFSQYMTKRAESAFESNDHAAYSALQEAVEEGSMDAVKFHFEMRGKYKKSIDVNVNVEEILTHVVEIVAKHVKDPDVILAVANDIEALEVESNKEGSRHVVPSALASGF